MDQEDRDSKFSAASLIFYVFKNGELCIMSKGLHLNTSSDTWVSERIGNDVGGKLTQSNKSWQNVWTAAYLGSNLQRLWILKWADTTDQKD
jgi:hypothetical protein